MGTTFVSWYAGANHYDYSELFNQGANTEINYYRAAPFAVQSFLFEQFNMRAIVVRHYGTQGYLTIAWYLDELDHFGYCVGQSSVIPEKFETLRHILFLQELAEAERARKVEEAKEEEIEIEITEPDDDEELLAV